MVSTIRDVATKSGFSITTVSRALNGYDDVSEKTREKIIRVAKELNYQPNRVAQNLVSKRIQTLGMFVLDRPTFLQPFIFEVISGLMDQASRQDFDLLLFGTQSLQGGLTPYQMCAQRGVGGAVIMGLKMDDPIIETLEDHDFPFVLIDIPTDGKSSTFITSDNQMGARQAVDHLVELGHRQIGFINGHAEAWVSVERQKGYEQGMKEHGLPLNESYIYYGDYSKESGGMGVRTLLGKHPEITAFFVASDLMASGAIEKLATLGIQVPEQISIVGFDDLDFASHIRPALTTIRQDKYRMGVEAAKRLISIVESTKDLTVQSYLPTSLVVRESTGKA